MSEPDVPFRPKFLDLDVTSDAEQPDPSTVPATPEQIDLHQNKLPVPGAPLTYRQKEIARLIANGKTNAEISEAVGCHSTFASTCRRLPEILDEVERYRDRLFEGDVAERLKELNQGAFAVAEDLIRNSGTKPQLKWDAAKWVLEKTTGKAVQAIDVQSSSLDAFYKLVTDMNARGEKLNPAIDVTPRNPGEAGALDAAEGTGFDAASWTEENT